MTQRKFLVWTVAIVTIVLSRHASGQSYDAYTDFPGTNHMGTTPQYSSYSTSGSTVLVDGTGYNYAYSAAASAQPGDLIGSSQSELDSA
jgi:hypothetical protein